MAKAKGDMDTADLFAGGSFYPVRTPQALNGGNDQKRDIATAMGEAIRMCGKPRARICVEMSMALGGEDIVTEAQLNAYTAESRTTHNISLVRFRAFVRATGCNWLWDHVLKDEGLIILEGEEAHLANAALLEMQAKEMMRMAEAAKRAAPIQAQFRKPRGGRH